MDEVEWNVCGEDEEKREAGRENEAETGIFSAQAGTGVDRPSGPLLVVRGRALPIGVIQLEPRCQSCATSVDGACVACVSFTIFTIPSPWDRWECSQGPDLN